MHAETKEGAEEPSGDGLAARGTAAFIFTKVHHQGLGGRLGNKSSFKAVEVIHQQVVAGQGTC